MPTESTLYNTYMALPDQHAAQDVFDRLFACECDASMTAGEQHWYYSHDQTTVDRASMACEDRGTRLMTLDEFLAIRNSILADNVNFIDRFIWVLHPVTAAQLAVKMRTNEQKTGLVTAYIMCKSSTKLEKKRSCWTNDTFSLFHTQSPHDYTNYSQAVHVCESPQQTNSIIPFPFLHYCLDSVTRWMPAYNSYWIFKQNVNRPARANDLQWHPERERRQKICWIKRPRNTVLHECHNHDLYYVIKPGGSNYVDARIECERRYMKLPLRETRGCLSLFVKKLGVFPAWISGVDNGQARTSDGPSPTSHLKSIVCAKDRTWSDVKHECRNYYDLFYIRQESIGHTFQEAKLMCHGRGMSLPLTATHDCVFWFVTKLGVNQAWMLDTDSGQARISGRSDQTHHRTHQTVICAKRESSD
ncbi:uncharacterized protein LOC135827120 [Sycon ciliatum]|uniref:uncharacterized protein LOC135827120 n=1 Tax=Sycon ciliatum TaxID=27933 RepID=UPI0031F6330D